MACMEGGKPLNDDVVMDPAKAGEVLVGDPPQWLRWGVRGTDFIWGGSDSGTPPWPVLKSHGHFPGIPATQRTATATAAAICRRHGIAATTAWAAAASAADQASPGRATGRGTARGSTQGDPACGTTGLRRTVTLHDRPTSTPANGCLRTTGAGPYRRLVAPHMELPPSPQGEHRRITVTPSYLWSGPQVRGPGYPGGQQQTEAWLRVNNEWHSGGEPTPLVKQLMAEYTAQIEAEAEAAG
jgi:hypothetical protein